MPRIRRATTVCWTARIRICSAGSCAARTRRIRSSSRLCASSVIPATACAEFSLAPSPGQRLLLLGSHGAVALLLLFANTGWLVWAALTGAALVLLIWRWRRLGSRAGWRLRVDGDRFAMHAAGGDALPVAWRLAYLSSRILVLRLDGQGVRRDLVL